MSHIAVSACLETARVVKSHLPFGCAHEVGCASVRKAAMGQSHAAAFWIPKTKVKLKVIERLLEESLDESLTFSVFERRSPEATFVVTSLDEREDLHLETELLHTATKALAKQLKVTAFSIYAFFGSADWMTVTAFSKAGRKLWEEDSDEDAKPAKVKQIAKKVGLKAMYVEEGDEDQWEDGVEFVTPITFPYWRMMSEAYTPPPKKDFLNLCIKPAFDFGPELGWKARGAVEVGEPAEPKQREPAPLPAAAPAAVERPWTQATASSFLGFDKLAEHADVLQLIAKGKAQGFVTPDDFDVLPASFAELDMVRLLVRLLDSRGVIIKF